MRAVVLFEGIHQSAVDSPHRGPVKWTFGVSNNVSSNKLLDKRSNRWWFQMLTHMTPLWWYFLSLAAVSWQCDCSTGSSTSSVCFIFTTTIGLVINKLYRFWLGCVKFCSSCGSHSMAILMVNPHSFTLFYRVKFCLSNIFVKQISITPVVWYLCVMRSLAYIACICSSCINNFLLRCLH